MTARLNEHGQPIGRDLPQWSGAKRPAQVSLRGTCAAVVPLDPMIHGDDLFAAFGASGAALWTYLPQGPFVSRAEFDAFLAETSVGADKLHYAIINGATGRAEGVASFLRIEPDIGTIEVGRIVLSLQLQKTRVASEAMYLMMAHAFDELGFRRCEWKCDNLNCPSKAAAQRYGFIFEGIFRQATIYKSRNRDTAWFSILDSEWPRVKAGFTVWLAADNFHPDGKQKRRLSTKD